MELVKKVASDKWKTYIITFIDYFCLHNMRMSYSQVKPNFQSSFDQSNFWLGLFDALVYLALGMGFFCRFLLEGKKNLLKSYIIFITIACAAYLVIPVVSLTLGNQVKDSYLLQEIVPGVGLLVFGFCQFPAWPTLLTLTSEHFNLEKEGTAIGTWSANGDLGNIVGFALAGFIVNGLQFRWEIAMIVAAGLKFFMGLVVFFFLEETSPTSG
jgi:sugar phosphate permease